MRSWFLDVVGARPVGLTGPFGGRAAMFSVFVFSESASIQRTAEKTAENEEIINSESGGIA